MTRHDGRDGVLVDELRMSVAPQQHAEIIEPGHHALKFDPVDQKDRERDFAFADMIEEGVLEILCAFGCHCRCSVFCSRLRARPSLPSIRRTLASARAASPHAKAVEAQGVAIRWQAARGRK